MAGSGDLQEETHLKVLRLLQGNPDMNQRELGQALGVSLGKVNYCVQALIQKGLLRVRSFRNSSNKRAYAYLLTPEGVAAKAVLTAKFLKRKTLEYELLRREIELLTHDEQPGSAATAPAPPAASRRGSAPE